MSNGGWIKIYRKFEAWEWYLDIPTRALFLHLLIKANYEPKVWRGRLIRRGEMITSLGRLSHENGCSINSVRASLKKLESSKDIIRESTQSFTLIKIVNFDTYQQFDQDGYTQPDTQVDMQAGMPSDTQPDNNIRNKKLRNKNFLESEKESFFSHTFLKLSRADAEALKISGHYRDDKDLLEQCERFVDHYEAEGKIFENFLPAMRKWATVRRDIEKKYGNGNHEVDTRSWDEIKKELAKDGN